MPLGWNALPGAIAILLLAVAAVASAQPAAKMARIGWLDTGDAAGSNEISGDFRQGLRDLKYIDG